MGECAVPLGWRVVCLGDSAPSASPEGSEGPQLLAVTGRYITAGL